MTSKPPPVRTPYASDDERLREEVRVLAVREQTAIVRALADELEHLAPWGTTAGLRHQLVEELARLGCRIVETAAILSRVAELEGDKSCGPGLARAQSPEGSRLHLVTPAPTLEPHGAEAVVDLDPQSHSRLTGPRIASTEHDAVRARRATIA